MKPKRIQLKRTKGWRMPANTVKVDRSTRYGNPFRVDGCYPVIGGKICSPLNPITPNTSAFKYESFTVESVEQCLAEFRRYAEQLDLSELRGKNLACWCKIGDPCHADVLLEMCNK